MNLRIAWIMPDGNLGIYQPGDALRQPGDTDAQLCERAIQYKGMDARPHKIFNANEFPKKTFRDAWTFDGQAITIDLPKAREIVLARVRDERNRRLVEADAEKARLDDVGTEKEKKDAKDKRQALRDLPAVVAIEIATMSVGQLETYQPTWPTGE